MHGMMKLVLLCSFVLLAAADIAKAPKQKRKWCNTTVHGFAGDYAYEACGSFCKEAKATNHCKFCKCRACTFCSSKGTPTSKAAPASAIESAPATEPKRKGGLLKKLKKRRAKAAGKGPSDVPVESSALPSPKVKKGKKLKRKKESS